MYVNWGWTGAMADIQEALVLNPGHSAARAAHAEILANFEQFGAAVAEGKEACKSNPLVAANRENLAGFQISAGDSSRGLAPVRRS
jgi:hypothetical protein